MISIPPEHQIILSPEELAVLAEDHWNDACALHFLERAELADIPERHQGHANSILTVVAHDAERPFRLTLLTDGAGDVYNIKKEYLDD